MNMPWHIAGIVIFAVFAFTACLSGVFFYGKGFDAGEDKGHRDGVREGYREGGDDQLKSIQRQLVTLGFGEHGAAFGDFRYKSKADVAHDLLCELTEDK